MKRNNIKNIIQEYFFQNPTQKLRVREIERTLKIPIPSVIRYVKELVLERFLKEIQIGTTKFYQADRSSNNFILKKRLYNINQIYDSGLVDYLKKTYFNPTIIVFGSYFLGEDIESSDIDLYVEISGDISISIPNKIEEKLKRKIQIFRYSSILEIENKFLANNIINGFTLNGFLEVLK